MAYTMNTLYKLSTFSKMHSVSSALTVLILSCAATVSAANWGFQDGSVSIRAKGAGVDGGEKQK